MQQAKIEMLQHDLEKGRIPLIDQWLADGKYTCTPREFAKMYGISNDRAYELCKSACPPPGFYSGTRYKILVSELEEYMRGLAKKKYRITA